MLLVTPRQMKRLEATADSDGVSYERLMLNAGRLLAEEVAKCASTQGSVLLLCGNGNNAGDCFVAGAILAETFRSVSVAMLCGEPKTELAKKTFARLPSTVTVLYDLESVKDAMRHCDVVCDGVFGTGFHGEVPPAVREVLATPTEAYRVAVDVPSGVDCSTGAVSLGTVPANKTVTFAYHKLGMALYPANAYCGDVVTVDIGITQEHYGRSVGDVDGTTLLLDRELVRLPYRSDLGNKGTFGRVLHVTGSKDMLGACIMASRAALRCGVGLVTVCTERHDLLPLAMPEPVYADRTLESVSRALERSTGVLIGCGLGTSKEADRLLRYVVKRATCPIVVDADGINLLSHCIDIIGGKDVVLTPHPLEMSRLAGIPVESVQSDRLGVATSFAKEHGCTVVLKGANTVVTDGYHSYVDTVANSGMAKGGSGDVLAGMVSSYVAQGLAPLEACKLAVYVHSQCGLRCAERLTKYSMLPTDVIDEIPSVLRSLA